METGDNGLPAQEDNRGTFRPITYNDIFPKSRWIEEERYFNSLPDNVQNLLCQVKEQEAYVRLAQEMTEDMDEMDVKEPMTDQQARLQKVRERLKRKLSEKNSS